MNVTLWRSVCMHSVFFVPVKVFHNTLKSELALKVLKLRLRHIYHSFTIKFELEDQLLRKAILSNQGGFQEAGELPQRQHFKGATPSYEKRFCRRWSDKAWNIIRNVNLRINHKFDKKFSIIFEPMWPPVENLLIFLLHVLLSRHSHVYPSCS